MSPRSLPADSTAGATAWVRAAAALLIFTAFGDVVLHGALLGDEVLSAATHFARTGPFPKEVTAHVPDDIASLSDSSHCFVPWLRFAADAWAADGRLPLWKDTAGIGAPFVGNGQSAVFFPTNLLAILAGAPPIALALQALAKLVAGAFGAWLLARHLGLSFTAAVLCGLVFGFGGFQMGWYLHPMSSASLFLPYLLLAADRLVLRPSPPGLALLAAMTGLQLLGGHPETVFHSQVVLTVLGAARLVSLRARHPARELWRRYAGLVAGQALGLALGAVQVLPLLEYLAHSAVLASRVESPHRTMTEPLAAAGFALALVLALIAARRLAKGAGTTLLPALALGGATIVGILLGLKAGLAPTFVLSVAPDWFGTSHHELGYGARVESTGAFAGAALPLAVLGFLAGRARGPVRAAGVLVAVGLLMGFRAPVVTDALEALPVFGLAVNTRLAMLALLGIAVLAAFGLDELGDVLRTARERRRLVLLVLVPLLAAFAALVVAVKLGDIASNVGPRHPEGASLTRAGLLPAADVAPLLPPETAPAQDVRTLSGYVVSKVTPASIRVLYGRERKSVAARWVAAPASTPSVYLFQASIPAWRLLPEQTVVRVLVTGPDGRLTTSHTLADPEHPGPLLPFPAQPAPGPTPQQLAVLLVALGLLLLPARPGKVLVSQRIALTLLVGLSLLPFDIGMVPLLPRTMFYPPSPVIDALRNAQPDGRSLAMGSTLLHAEIPTFYGVADVRSLDALEPQRAAALASAALGRLAQVPLRRRAANDPSGDEPDLALLGLLSVKLLAWVGNPPPAFREVPIAGTKDGAAAWHVVENPSWLPRARLVGGAAIEPDDTRAIERLAAPDFPRDRCLVFPEGPAVPVPAEGIGSARIVLSRPDAVTVEVQPSASGWLVLSDTFFPGWQARVDGSPREILRANVALRAVAVGPGDRLVEFRYEPASFRIGAAVSVATLVLLVAACGVAAWRRRLPAGRAPAQPGA